MQAFKVSTYSKLDGPFSLSFRGHGIHIFRKALEIWSQKSFPLCVSVHFKRALAQRWWQRFSIVFTCSMALYDRALTYICGWHGKLCSQTMISGSVTEPIQWFPWLNHVCFQCSATGSPEDHVPDTDFWLCPLHRGFSRFCKSLDDYMSLS